MYYVTCDSTSDWSDEQTESTSHIKWMLKTEICNEVKLNLPKGLLSLLPCIKGTVSTCNIYFRNFLNAWIINLYLHPVWTAILLNCWVSVFLLAVIIISHCSRTKCGIYNQYFDHHMVLSYNVNNKDELCNSLPIA